MRQHNRVVTSIIIFEIERGAPLPSLFDITLQRTIFWRHRWIIFTNTSVDYTADFVTGLELAEEGGATLFFAERDWTGLF